MPGDKDDKNKDEDKKSDDGKKDDKSEKDDKSDKGDKDDKEDKKEDDDKLSAEQQKQVNKLVDRMGKFSTHMETAVNKIDHDKRSGDSQDDFKRMENMRKEIEPFLVRDDEKMGQEVKVEVENALLTIMDLKYKADQEVLELKKLLRDRNQKIFELEKENKQLKEHNLDLQDALNGGPGRAKRSTQQNINMAMHSQDGEGFDRADDDQQLYDQPVYDQPPSQDDEDDFWQEGKAAKGGYGNENDLWITGNKDNLPTSNINAYNAPGNKAQAPGFKSIPKRPQGYNANEDMAFYGVGAKKV